MMMLAHHLHVMTGSTLANEVAACLFAIWGVNFGADSLQRRKVTAISIKIHAQQSTIRTALLTRSVYQVLIIASNPRRPLQRRVQPSPGR